MKTIITFFILLCAASPAVAAGEFVSYEVNNAPYEGYFISPSADAPLILMIHDWDGLTDYEIKRAGMLADKGYAVFTADLFGKDIRPTELKDKQRLTEELYKDRKKMRALLYGALEAANAKGVSAHNAVAMGYCFGGAVVLELARSGADLKAFVSFHGGLETPTGQDYAETKGFVLIFHGTADTHVPMDQFAELAKALEKETVSHEMTTYSGAPHAFTVFDTERYRKDADQKSWSRFMEFLDKTLK
jgi:dienelactone hydrolase